jgi:hypothetical protein
MTASCGPVWRPRDGSIWPRFRRHREERGRSGVGPSQAGIPFPTVGVEPLQGVMVGPTQAVLTTPGSARIATSPSRLDWPRPVRSPASALRGRRGSQRLSRPGTRNPRRAPASALRGRRGSQPWVQPDPPVTEPPPASALRGRRGSQLRLLLVAESTGHASVGPPGSARIATPAQSRSTVTREASVGPPGSARIATRHASTRSTRVWPQRRPSGVGEDRN